MDSWINTPAVSALLDSLYDDASKNDRAQRQSGTAARLTDDDRKAEYWAALRNVYMPVSREFGNLLYALVRSTGARTVVEFGLSRGVSTIFLAAALRDNGGGRVITTEFDAPKAEIARKNLAAADLEDWVEIRVGDALETLKNTPDTIDLMLLDGAKSLYLDVLKLLEPRLHGGSIVASDNTDVDALAPFLEYLRTPGNGYTSAAILTGANRGHEVTVRN